MILKPIGAELSIASGNTVGNNVLVRVINTGAAAVLHFNSNSTTEYANLTVSNTNDVIVEKLPTDLLKGANMLAVPVVFRS